MTIVKRSIKILCLLLTIVLLTNCCMIFFNNYDYNSIISRGFYLEPKDSLDVIFLGASDVFTGFSSAYAYEQFGFTSYPYAFDANSSQMLLSQLREVLTRQNPQMIVIEINAFLYNPPTPERDEARFRKYLDNIPFSMNKVRSIKEFVSEDEQMFYLFPLAKYHENWKATFTQIGKVKDNLAIRSQGYSLLKGTVTNLSRWNGNDIRNVNNDYSTCPLDPQLEEILVAFLEFCKTNQLDNILFVRFPHAICTDWTYERFQKCNEAERIIKSYGFDFINLERDNGNIGLDYSGDFYNEDHVYLTGQKKITEYFGKVLVESYGLTPRIQTSENKTIWNTSALYYQLFYDYCEEARNNGNEGVRYETRGVMAQLNDMYNMNNQ